MAQVIKLVNFIEQETNQKYQLDNTVGITTPNRGEIFNDYDNNQASGGYSHAEGINTKAEGEAAHAEGLETRAEGNYSHAEGCVINIDGKGPQYTHALGIGSHAEGGGNLAEGNYSHAEGYYNEATGAYSHAEGASNIASGTGAHVEGNSSTAEGDFSHAQGYGVHAIGQHSHASGQETIAEADYSFAHGQGVFANRKHEFVIGSYNKVHTDESNIVFAIGNGSDSDEEHRNDALTVTADGILYINDIKWLTENEITTSVKTALNSVYAALQLQGSTDLVSISKIVNNLNTISAQLAQLNATAIHFTSPRKCSVRAVLDKITGGD